MNTDTRMPTVNAICCFRWVGCLFKLSLLCSDWPIAKKLLWWPIASDSVILSVASSLILCWYAAQCSCLADRGERMSSRMTTQAVRLIHKCLWKGGADDLYKTSFRENLRSGRSAVSMSAKRHQTTVSPIARYKHCDWMHIWYSGWIKTLFNESNYNLFKFWLQVFTWIAIHHLFLRNHFCGYQLI